MMVGWIFCLLFGIISGWSLEAEILLFLTFASIFVAGSL